MPHATFVSKGSGACGEYCTLECNSGWLDCDSNSSNGCETATTSIPALHERVETAEPAAGCSGGSDPVSTIGSCNVVCESGWSDCDNTAANGCETRGECPSPFGFTDSGKESGVDAATGPQEIATLVGEPRGLAACGDRILFFDDSLLTNIDATTLVKSTWIQSPSMPAGGIACNASYTYWTTLPDADASAPNGALYGVLVGTSFVEKVADGLDPVRGIAVQDERVVFLTPNGLQAITSTDDAAVPWMPATQTGAYEPFAVSARGDWSIASGGIFTRPADGGPVSPWLNTAAATALMTNASGSPFAIVGDNVDDAGVEGGVNHLAALSDDAGAPTLASFDASTMEPIVATTSGGPTVIAASLGTVYDLALASGSVSVVAKSSGPVIDVATDGVWAYWTAGAHGNFPASIWRAKLP